MDFDLIYRKFKFLIYYFFHGLKEGFDDNSYFNKQNYVEKYSDVKNSGMGPVKHYFKQGIAENRTDTYDDNIKYYSMVESSGLFDFDYYCEENDMHFDTYNQGLLHYLEFGYKLGFNPSKYFDGNFYSERYPDVKKKNLNPLVHYLLYGVKENAIYNKNQNLSFLYLVKNSGFFDFEYYLKVSNFKFNTINEAIHHYLEFGYKMDLNPSDKFDGVIYLKKYSDVREHNFNPLVHYLKFGKKEGRTDGCDKNIKEYSLVKNSKLFDLDYYQKNSNKKFGSYRRGLLHYLETGYNQDLNPSNKFNAKIYLKKYPHIKKENWNPLVHYLKFGRYNEMTDVCDKNIKEFSLVSDSGWFDLDYYQKESNLTFDSVKSGLVHYLEFGYKQNLNPSDYFNGDSYLKFNPDVKSHNWNPLVHYLKYGKIEGRVFTSISHDDYLLVKYSGLFDLDYYQKESNLTFDSERLGLIHYLETGFKEGFNPSARFDGVTYYEKYSDVANSGVNPLLHYLKYGITENRDGIKKFNYISFNEIFDVKNTLNHISQKVTIIMPLSNLFNSKKAVRNLYNMAKNFDLILIDTLNLNEDDLTYFRYYKNLKIIKNINSHEDFIDSLNNIVNGTSNDILLLKDNIRIFKNSILKLIIAAYSDYNIGFVTPISNFSTMYLIDLPKNKYSSKFINNISKKEYLESPLSNDSCVYIKNDVFTGLEFDRTSDKNSAIYDLSNKAQMKGWKSVVDDSTFVYWEMGQFENTQKDKYNLSSPYYALNNPNKEFIQSGMFSNIYDKVNKYSKEEFGQFTKKTILFAMHYGGGVEFTVKDIINSISNEYDCYLLKAFKNKMILFRKSEIGFEIVEEFKLQYDWNSQIVYSDEYEQIYFYILINYNIDIVEIDHSIFHTFDLAAVAKSLDIPVILTLHDFYYICPTYFLLDENNNYCAGNCGDGSRNCSTRVSWFDLPANIVEWKHEWNQLVEGLFDSCDIIATATSFTKNMFLEHYPNLSPDKIVLIEHGRNLIRYDNIHRIPNEHQSIRILIPGVIGPHKGKDFIKELKKCDVENRLELHYIGVVDDELASIGTYHGRYDRDDFSKNVYRIKPSFIGIFSVCAETYSYTLTESFSVGVPVLASDLGALKTRIESNGGGWLLDINNPEQSYKEILEISHNREEYVEMQNNMKDIKLVSIDEMANNYRRLYKYILNQKI
ncbi:MAG: glycosyltransferase [Methanobrevibacter sp.]|uniref:glycosyltransferase n=1 Tax=Methanobrevibacter sp. TaxID=66852 RepID=UPI002E784F9B|nr:glycosyltransferase [Methanobrevibacter sp.]MEE0942211.1 glycosyltransferase [Methanobrevibacter sp.]